jgi:5S rRNA maturation endonuclease (ribonuclease M5)
MTQLKNLYHDRARINELTDQAVLVADEILDEFGVDYRSNYKRFYGPCPVHGGDNQSAFNLFPEGYDVRGMWVCHTKHCEKKWKRTFIGFIHAMLSKEYREPIPWTAAADWLVKYLGYTSLADIEAPDEYTLKQRYATSAAEKWSLTQIRDNTGWNRLQVRNNLEIPATYYLNRGFSENTLDRYDIGYYNKHERVVVPVYDDDYNYAVGFSSRSIHDQCPQCGYWHNPNKDCLPAEQAFKMHCKWRHSDGFNSAHWLYNYWFAKRHIEESGVVILVEGPGDVWRLEEAGIRNSVALFGVDLTEEQLTILEMSGALSVIVMLDNDEAGQKAAPELKKKMERIFRLYFPTLSGDDVGDNLNRDELTGTTKQLVERTLSTWNGAMGIS